MRQAMRIHVKLLLSVVLAMSCVSALAQNPSDSVSVPTAPDSLKADFYTDTYLDTVNVNRVFELNDYSLIGIEYGVSFSRMTFNPPQTQSNLFAPNTFGIFYTRYGKMFSYLPYFGFKVGFRYSHEGYRFKENKDTKTTYNIEGATEAIMDVAEVPLMAHLHIDGLHFKAMADLGIYGGYRLSIKRTGENVYESIANSFKDTDRRFD